LSKLQKYLAKLLKYACPVALVYRGSKIISPERAKSITQGNSPVDEQ